MSPIFSRELLSIEKFIPLEMEICGSREISFEVLDGLPLLPALKMEAATSQGTQVPRGDERGFG